MYLFECVWKFLLYLFIWLGTKGSFLIKKIVIIKKKNNFKKLHLKKLLIKPIKIFFFK